MACCKKPDWKRTGNVVRGKKEYDVYTCQNCGATVERKA